MHDMLFPHAYSRSAFIYSWLNNYFTSVRGTENAPPYMKAKTWRITTPKCVVSHPHASLYQCLNHTTLLTALHHQLNSKLSTQPSTYCFLWSFLKSHLVHVCVWSGPHIRRLLHRYLVNFSVVTSVGPPCHVPWVRVCVLPFSKW